MGREFAEKVWPLVDTAGKARRFRKSGRNAEPAWPGRNVFGDCERNGRATIRRRRKIRRSKARQLSPENRLTTDDSGA